MELTELVPNAASDPAENHSAPCAKSTGHTQANHSSVPRITRRRKSPSSPNRVDAGRATCCGRRYETNGFDATLAQPGKKARRWASPRV